jgi:hypothetical protein
MLLATIACYLGLGAILMFFDPFTGGIAILILFSTSLILSLIGTFALIGLIVRLIFTRDNLAFKKVTTSFRQGIWLSLLICVSLYLNKYQLFDIKYVALLILALVILEVFFISYKSKPNQRI